MNVNEPVDEDGPHVLINLRLVVHVVGSNPRCRLVLPEVRVHFLDVFGGA